ncbi:hypothetical protein O181_092333 [Austropuccinia psidii MF-1]|uniref:Uncharacterized protein n=1 Tax=Austropuccinia psidii MF-1 TaxID=1389203 RepID=A0A9Q3P8A6_9BASI|nr:hypothetical protein [Austropuccinia psidii MF-1]
MVTSLLDWSEVIIWAMKDGDGKRTFELGPIVTMSCHPWNSNAKVNSPVPSLPCEQTLRKLTPGPSGTQCSEDLFCSKQPEFHLISTLDSSELTVPPFVEPSQMDEPPIPGPSPSSKPHEDVPTCEPEPAVDPTQSMEEPFARLTPPHSIITIDDTPVGYPLLFPLIPTTTLARNLPAYDRP